MTVDQIIHEFKELGDPRAVAVWKRIGFDTTNYYGVNLTKLKNLAKKVKKNHDLALELWATGFHEARLLSILIEEPKKVTPEQIEQQSNAFDFWDLSDYYCRFIVAKTPFIESCIQKWLGHENEFTHRSAYILISELAKSAKEIDGSFFLPILNTIEKNIRNEKNWVKEGMLYALMSIGSRNANLNKSAISVSRNIGNIVVDYGETSCQTPNPLRVLTSDKTQQKITGCK